MPGKVNPTQAGKLSASPWSSAYKVMGQRRRHRRSRRLARQFRALNVFKPVIIFNYLHSVELLADAMNSFVGHCVQGIEVNTTQIEHYVHNSLMLVTALAPKIRLRRARRPSRQEAAHHSHISLRGSPPSISAT